MFASVAADADCQDGVALKIAEAEKIRAERDVAARKARRADNLVKKAGGGVRRQNALRSVTAPPRPSPSPRGVPANGSTGR
jgi:hypothetical protein